MSLWAEIVVSLIIAVCVLIICGTIAYIYYVKYLAKVEVAGQPRVPMFECKKHGFFRHEQLIMHLDCEVCPFCFNEQVMTRLDSTVGMN